MSHRGSRAGLVLLGLYVIAFALAVFRGRLRGWSDGIGFVYSRGEIADEAAAAVFKPLYRVVHRFGIVRLSQPFGTVR